ncbi:hypothetical protein [Xylanibacter ruminicola]|uniref:hypothetical protein n=1 Tax=Xylanibacter ruminicola TaxID=839 RepID=UPI000490C73E|nr:hypothetical protein [Xylanibacter ruminicola]
MKRKSKQKYKPLSDATPGELREAFKIASFWLTDELEDCTEFGAFSEANLGEPAIEYFPKRAYLSLKDPNSKWHWKEGTKLSTLMINVIKSDMAHRFRDYHLDGDPLLKANCEFEREGADEDGFEDANEPEEIDPEVRMGNYQVLTEMEKLAELEQYQSQRDKGMRIARAAAKQSGDPKLVIYVELAFTLPDYRAISKKMRVTQTEVKEMEERLIAMLTA